jgi:REP-associated tyrosine transposase
MRDRRRYLYWVFEAKKRFGLYVLDYIVTSNHVHLLVKDTGSNVIAESMQLIAGRTAQEYNQRKGKQGAFWEDRYHATAIEADEHLHRCLVYVDLNMVRAIEYCSPFQLFQTFNRFAPFKTFQINGRSKFKVQCDTLED